MSKPDTAQSAVPQSASILPTDGTMQLQFKVKAWSPDLPNWFKNKRQEEAPLDAQPVTHTPSVHVLDGGDSPVVTEGFMRSILHIYRTVTEVTIREERRPLEADRWIITIRLGNESDESTLTPKEQEEVIAFIKANTAKWAHKAIIFRHGLRAIQRGDTDRLCVLLYGPLERGKTGHVRGGLALMISGNDLALEPLQKPTP